MYIKKYKISLFFDRTGNYEISMFKISNAQSDPMR